jgi:Ca2+-binding RTX toxin-like protein
MRSMRRTPWLVVSAASLALAGGIGSIVPAHAAVPTTCESRVATIVGTDGADVIHGTQGDDVIVGLGGNDVIDGRGGNDVICGGAGNDVLRGGSGDDILRGDAGRDVVQGGTGADVCTAEVARCAQATPWPISIAFPTGLTAGQDDPIIVTVTNPTATPVDATLTVTFTAGLTSDQQVSDAPWSCAGSPTSSQVQCSQSGFTGTSYVRFDTLVGVAAGTPVTVQACLAVSTGPTSGPMCVTGKTTVTA